MIGKNLEWSSGIEKSKNLPQNFISYGKPKSGENFNICRVSIGTSKVPGKLSDEKCFASLGGEKIEKYANEFEALIENQK